MNAARMIFTAMAVWAFASERSEAEESNEPVDSKVTVFKLLPSIPKGFPPAHRH